MRDEAVIGRSLLVIGGRSGAVFDDGFWILDGGCGERKEKREMLLLPFDGMLELEDGEVEFD